MSIGEAPELESVVRFDKVSKLFDGQKAVDDLDFSIARGEFFSLLGPSGCGKTTTLRLIAGFEQPDQGAVYIDGADVSGVPPFRRNVNTVFQSYALFPHLNVFENVAFGLRRRGVSDSEIKTEVMRSLALVRLEGYEKRRVQQLSGGQQQRVALARALVNKPSVLLLDEPMAALDSQLKREMRHELKALQRQLGITFVLVTHDQEEALTMSDRVAVLSEGRMQQVSPPEQLYRRPENRFVAEFIGRANFLPVEVKDSALTFLGRPLAGEPPPCGRDQYWMLRPESLHLGEPREGDNVVSGTIIDSTFVGPIIRHRVDLGDGHVLLVEEPSNKKAAVPSGQVQVSWSHEAGRLLHREDTP